MKRGKLLTLKDVQEQGLEILLDVHDFCIKNGIRYFLGGGTLLGAVRHKGYIPWDDDVDLYMLRPDYERFLSIYQSEKYELLHMGNNKDYFLPYAHVVDTKKTISDFNYDPYTKGVCGMKIDIFPIDNVSDNESEFDDQFARANQVWNKFVYARKAFWGLRLNKSLGYNCFVLKRKLLTCNGNVVFKYARQIDEIAHEHKFGSTNHVGLPCIPLPRAKQRHFVSEFDETVLLDFEGYKLCAMKGYHNVLTTAFGDYMTPPPEGQRKGPHSMKIYFKEQ